MNTDVDQLQRECSLLRPQSRDLNGYLEPLKHLCTVLNISNEIIIIISYVSLSFDIIFYRL